MMGANVQYVGKSDVGRRRDNNEDAYIAQEIWNENTILAVAIDGVGGYEGGERAAALAQEKIVEYLESYPNGERAGLLKRAVIYANNAIYEERAKDSRYSRMSCVLTASLVDCANRQLYMAHVGDTRLYCYTNGELTKLSHDHSYVGYCEEIGELTELEAMHHPERNVISRDVGSQLLQNSEEKYVEVSSFALPAHAVLLLCSDGLCDMITSQQMKDILQQNDLSINDKCDALVAAANEAGGKDNITVVLVETLFEEEVVVAPTEENPEQDTANEAADTPEEEITPDTPQKSNEKRCEGCRRWKITAITSWIVTILVIANVAVCMLSHHRYIQEEEQPMVSDTTTVVNDSIDVKLQPDSISTDSIAN